MIKPIFVLCVFIVAIRAYPFRLVNPLEERSKMQKDRLSATSLDDMSVNSLEERGQMKQDRMDATSLDDILEDQSLNRLRVLPRDSGTLHYQRYRATKKACRYLWGHCKTDKDCCRYLDCGRTSICVWDPGGIFTWGYLSSPK